MPELPEVETIRRQLEPELRGTADRAARGARPALVAPGRARGAGGARSAGGAIEGLGRRGKYLLLRLDGDETLVMHLRMTGNLLLVDGRLARTLETAHLRARFRLDDGRELWFTDPRRFGEAFLLDTAALEERFAGRLGVEPFSERVHRRGAGARWRPAAGRR